MDNIQIPITENGTTTLATAGKYCDRNIEVNVNVNGATNDRYEEGKQAEYDAFWDVYQGPQRLHYAYAFSYTGWTDDNYNPKYPIATTNATGIQRLFEWNMHVTDTKVPITAYGSCSQAFYEARALKRIPKLIFAGVTNVTNMFLNCSKLEELNCEGELTIGGLDLKSCTKLNKASIVSVIGILSTTTSGLSVTISKTAVENAFGSTEAEEWTTLIGTRSNWTINLV